MCLCGGYVPSADSGGLDHVQGLCQVGHGGCKVLLVCITEHYGILGSIKTRVSDALKHAPHLLCFSDGLTILIKVCVGLVELLKELLQWVVLRSSIPMETLYGGIRFGDCSGGV